MRKLKLTAAILTAGLAVSMLAGAASADEITFPLEETATFTGMISYPSGTEEDPNKRTIFKRLEEELHGEYQDLSGPLHEIPFKHNRKFRRS